MTDEEMAEEWVDKEISLGTSMYNPQIEYYCKQAFLAGLKAGRPQWHKLDWKKDFPDVDKLVRVRTKSGEEYICQTYLYYPTEDEIGYGSVIIQFEELNGDWVDDNEIEYWCEIPTFDKDTEKWVDNYEDYQNASNDITFSQYPAYRGK